jgi:hypothetical protein
MKVKPALVFLAGVACSGTLLLCQSGSHAAVIVNLAGARGTHEATDPAGSEGVVLREDPQSGGMELLARYPAGHRDCSALARIERTASVAGRPPVAAG